MIREVPPLEQLTKAYQLAFAILGDEGLALDTTLKCAQSWEREIRDQNDRKRHKIDKDSFRQKLIMNEELTFQFLALKLCERKEKEQERAGLDGTGPMPHENFFVTRYIKHILYKTVQHRSFHVAVGLGRLLYDYSKREVSLIHDTLAQDLRLKKDDQMHKDWKLKLLKNLAEKRFPGLLTVKEGVQGSKHFEKHPVQSRLVEPVARSLELFRLWGARCALPEMTSKVDNRGKIFEPFKFGGMNPDEEGIVEERRMRAIICPECFTGLTRLLKLESPAHRLGVPVFNLPDKPSQIPPVNFNQPPPFTPEKAFDIFNRLKDDKHRRKTSRAHTLSIEIEGVQRATIDIREPSRLRKLTQHRLFQSAIMDLRERKSISLALDEDDDLIQIYSIEGTEPLLVGSLLLSGSGALDGSLPWKGCIKLESGHLLEVVVTSSQVQTREDVGAQIKVTYSSNPMILGNVFERAVRLHNKPNALNYKRDGVAHSISFDELIARARNIMLGLHSLGVRRGDRVAILSENCPEWTLSDAGCQVGGVVDVPIHPTSDPEDVCEILKTTGPRVLFVQDSAAFAGIEQAIEFGTLEHMVFFAEQGAKEAGALTLAQLEERGRELDRAHPQLAKELAQAVQPHDPATIIYTSGTTGKPKGVILTHSNLVTNILACSDRLAPSEKDVVISLLPLSHALERLSMYVYIHQGMSVYYAEPINFDHPSASKEICKILRKVRPTVMVGVPLIFEKIYAGINDKVGEGKGAKAALLAWANGVRKDYLWHEIKQQRVRLSLKLRHKVASWLVFSKWRAEVGGRVRLFISGEEPLSERIERDFIESGIPIVQGYGLTETSPVIAVGTHKKKRIGTVGPPIRGVEVKIADDGEILTRGPCVMVGYVDDPNETMTCKAFTPDDFYKTGDIGELDGEGYLIVKGRKIEIEVTTEGATINPQHIKHLIKKSPFVKQVVVKHVVLARDDRPSLVAVIVPNFEQIKYLANLEGIEARTPRALCDHPRIRDLFESEVSSLTGFRTRFKLLPQEFTREKGELSPNYKVREERVIENNYEIAKA